ncbi:MAG: hypothetical protein ACREJB_18690, partial [Planctomycetaceae bacterium]
MAETQTIRPEIHRLLRGLRWRIRLYVLCEGVALILLIAGLVFWVSLGLDWLYFKTSNLELPVAVRGVISFAALVGVPAAALWLLAPLLKALRARALALVLERRYPQLNDRLITAVETSQSGERPPTPLTAAMLERTTNDLGRILNEVRVGEVFRRGPLGGAVSFALIMLLSVGALALLNTEAMARWSDAYLRLKERYWERETDLRVMLIVQPGDQVREFDDNRHAKHPRGGDLKLRVVVPETPRPDGRAWTVPDRVLLDYREDHGRSNSLTMTKVGDRTFEHTFTAQRDGLELRVTGHDYTSPESYRVEVVEPPRIDALSLICTYPEYTGLNADGPRRTVPVQGNQTALPAETLFVLTGRANKPLAGVM